jgi:MYXO-CTERM domain-containing protein
VSYGVFEAIVFDPYLLLGDPGRPGILEAYIPPETVLSVPLGINIIVASGSFQLAVSADVYAELEGNAITAATETETVIVDAWDLAVSLGADPTSPLDVWATLEAYLYFEITLTLHPAVVLTVLGSNYTLAEIGIPVDTPPIDTVWQFDPVELSFDPPSDAQTHGGNGSGDSSSTTFSDCGCNAAPGEPGPPIALLVLSVLGLVGRGRRGRG